MSKLTYQTIILALRDSVNHYGQYLVNGPSDPAALRLGLSTSGRVHTAIEVAKALTGWPMDELHDRYDTIWDSVSRAEPLSEDALRNWVNAVNMTVHELKSLNHTFSFSLNDKVSFKPTERGVSVMLAHFLVAFGHKENAVACSLEAYQDTLNTHTGKCELQMHDFAYIFGKYLVSGSKQDDVLQSIRIDVSL